MGRELGALKHQRWGERYGMSHTCYAEIAGGCHIPVTGRELWFVTHVFWGERWGCHSPVMGRELGAVTHL